MAADRQSGENYYPGKLAGENLCSRRDKDPSVFRYIFFSYPFMQGQGNVSKMEYSFYSPNEFWRFQKFALLLIDNINSTL